MAGAVSLWRREAVFLTAMLAGETSIVGLSTLFKVATSKGLNIYPFLSYSYLLASLLLLPSLFFTNRSRSLPPLSASILSKIGLLGFLGSMYVITGGIGIEYSNPTLASAIGNIVPALTFILAVIFRMEKVSFKERSSVAKVMGTILSLIGAFVVIFYHGPRVFVASSPPYLNFRQLSPPLSSSKSDWLIGGAILTIQGIFVSVSFILQGIITSVYYVIHSWAIRHKRPLYLAIFKPLSILIAVVMGTIFLNDSLYLGCLIGGILITLGFYVVMWGKANEEKNKLLSFSGKEKTPLLLSGKNDQI
ncbi:nodulin MtN21 /EamA-like transporter family protein [Arabidopsis thaliana]|uniref:WAT1-related protein n=2 Tax=Arabidopsis thaliana TaxID=3702 RepID=F4IYZ1_ARATH|nr:nodulin MtN21 /EamA-like transporter family protein [Arabidopsis thaliana]AEE77402.1 nodulin MtN21 /EamA-like transporter family protein [Arabidopsis thaliana]|eukprot:NP_001189993.1 nodulin MtN21 /EamA-like transporter family protein [Arabidopsis thaliana]